LRAARQKEVAGENCCLASVSLIPNIQPLLPNQPPASCDELLGLFGDN
jgi:hypothetical protein